MCAFFALGFCSYPKAQPSTAFVMIVTLVLCIRAFWSFIIIFISVNPLHISRVQNLRFRTDRLNLSFKCPLLTVKRLMASVNVCDVVHMCPRMMQLQWAHSRVQMCTQNACSIHAYFCFFGLRSLCSGYHTHLFFSLLPTDPLCCVSLPPCCGVRWGTTLRSSWRLMQSPTLSPQMHGIMRGSSGHPWTKCSAMGVGVKGVRATVFVPSPPTLGT